VATDPTLPLNAALYGALNAALAVPVYDIQAPQDAAFPYVTIGELISAPDDTKGEPAMDVLATFHVWSRSRSSAEAKGIMAQIYAALHMKPLAATGATVNWCRMDVQQTTIDPDGITHHALARYQIRIEAA